MPAYFIIELEVADPSKLVEYERAATEHVVAAGGRFIVRSNNYKTIEGDWKPQRMVIIEFPDIETIERYYHSDINKELSQIRLAGSGGAKSRALAIKGLDSAAVGERIPKEAGKDATGAVIWN